MVSGMCCVMEFGVGMGKFVVGLFVVFDVLGVEFDEYLIVDLFGELCEW